MTIDIKVLGPGDEAILNNVAPGVFDHTVDHQATREFLADPRHHIVVAIESGLVVGFASGVHYIHPDKPCPELWVNEVGVSPTHRGRGIAKAVLQALFDFGRGLGCVEAWVLTEHTNVAAMRLYSSNGGAEATPDQVMFSFRLDT